MYTQSQIDPAVSFRNAEGESARGTIVNLQRKSLVMEVYNPASIVQVSEVLDEFTVRFGTQLAYQGKAVVISLVNTGLTAVVSATLIDEWNDLDMVTIAPGVIAAESEAFVEDWSRRFIIRPGYQIVVSEMRAYLSDVSRWVDQVDLSKSLPKESGQLRDDVFYELAAPLIRKVKFFFDALNSEAAQVNDEQAAVHRAYAQAALHPLLLRAPFVFRAYSKPLGYAGDYQMVNQILNNPRQGPSTYFQMVNTAFLEAAVVVAHRNRIDLLVNYLKRIADSAHREGKTYRILNVGCGPAIEIQRFLLEHPHPNCLSFDLMDFSEETLSWTQERLNSIIQKTGKQIKVNYLHDSVHQLLKRRISPQEEDSRDFDAVYCAGLFDYLSDKVCKKLTSYFASRTRHAGTLLITNVHSSNPERSGMEHILEWYLIYRNEEVMDSILPAPAISRNIYVDATGVNVFAEAIIQ